MQGLISHPTIWCRARHFSEPTFDPPEPQNFGKTPCFAIFFPKASPMLVGSRLGTLSRGSDTECWTVGYTSFVRAQEIPPQNWHRRFLLCTLSHCIDLKVAPKKIRKGLVLKCFISFNVCLYRFCTICTIMFGIWYRNHVSPAYLRTCL